MWLSPFALYDPQRWRAEVAYFDELRETFDDPLPLHSYAPYHPLMIHNHVAENRAKQVAVLQAIAAYQHQEEERGKQMAQEFIAANPPKPGEPGYKPPQPGQPGYKPPAPGQPGYNPPPGQPGHDPSQPHDPNAPEPSVPSQVYEEQP